MVQWLSGWAKRRQITIDHTRINSDLTNFPILLYLSASSGINGADVTSIFDEVGANRKKIAVTLADGVTQCYVEVEKWDAVNEKAWLWVKVPSISSTSDTILYIYYDNTQPDNTDYVGDPGETPAPNVWDEHFVLVTHMKDDPDTSHVKDSTVNANHGTKKAANEPIEADGKIAKAQHHDANDYIDCGADSSLDITSQVTLEAWVNVDATQADYTNIVGKRTSGGDFAYMLYKIVDTTRLRPHVKQSDGTYKSFDSAASLGTGAWKHVAMVADGSNLRLYIDGTEDGNSPVAYDGTIKSLSTTPVRIGNDLYETLCFDGYIDECRISNAGRSAAWIKATYETGRDNLLTWGSEETPAPLLIHRLPARIPARNPIYKVPA